MKKKISIICLIMLFLFSFTACGKDNVEEDTQEKVQNGPVESPAAFIQIGLFIDVVSEENVTNRSYEIIQDEVAAMRFTYNGLACELRGSSVYSDYDLAGVLNSSDGNVIIQRIGECIASIYTLNPGRIIFWNDGQINYSLYIKVTADDEVVKGILSDIVFENHYNERADVIKGKENDSVAFANRIVSVIQDKDMETLADMLYYPQQLGGGQSAGNAKEFLMLSSDEIFTTQLLNAVNTSALSELRMTPDETEYLLGSNQKNVHFKQMSDGSFKITKINN